MLRAAICSPVYRDLRRRAPKARQLFWRLEIPCVRLCSVVPSKPNRSSLPCMTLLIGVMCELSTECRVSVGPYLTGSCVMLGPAGGVPGRCSTSKSACSAVKDRVCAPIVKADAGVPVHNTPGRRSVLLMRRLVRTTNRTDIDARYQYSENCRRGSGRCRGGDS